MNQAADRVTITYMENGHERGIDWRELTGGLTNQNKKIAETVYGAIHTAAKKGLRFTEVRINHKFGKQLRNWNYIPTYRN